MGRKKKMDNTSAEGFVKQMMLLYDLATELAPKEAKSHRETFDLICQYLELEWKIAQGKKVLGETERNITKLKGEIGERLGTLAILQAIQQGRKGYG